MQRHELEQQENHHDRREREGDFLHICRDRREIGAADLGCVRVDSGLRRAHDAAFPGAEQTEQQHGENRPHRTERHQAEAVRLDAFVTADVRDTDTEGENERHRHRARRNPAGVERDPEEVRVGNRGKGENGRVASQKDVTKLGSGQDSHHTDGKEEPDARPDNKQEDVVIDVRHRLR